MTVEPGNKSPRQVWIGIGLVIVLGVLLVADKVGDGWDLRQWLIGGAIVLWAMGPALVGGIVGAQVFSRSATERSARRGAAGLAIAGALFAAAVTCVIVRPETVVRYRPGARIPFSSDLMLVISIQTMMGTLLSGYFSQYAAFLHACRTRADIDPVLHNRDAPSKVHRDEDGGTGK